MKNLRSVLASCLVAGLLAASVMGCARTDQRVYVAGEPGVATITNRLRVPLFLPGCAPFITQQSLDGVWVDLGPPFVCFWEGIAVEVGERESVATPFAAPIDTGRYRILYDANLGCDPGLPLSEANCPIQREVITRAFEVERELCDPSEFGCQFVPGAPNYLCDDGVNFGGPSGECTRDPSTGACGYEFLTCP